MNGEKIMTDKITVCFQIANTSHAHQRRWDGSPYMSHVNAVRGNVIKAVQNDRLISLTEYNYEMAQCAALLHDVIEDCMDAHQLRILLLSEGLDDGWVDELMDILEGELTHGDDLTYMGYINKIKSVVGVLVKYCDMQHNMSCSMKHIIDNEIVDKAARQMEKYGKPFAVITKRLLDYASIS